MPNTDQHQTLPSGLSGATARQPRHRWRWVLLVAILAAVAGVAWVWTPAQRYARTGASYGARVACACRYIGGRGLADCQKDMEGAVGWVTLSDDPATRTVTARYPLLAGQSATYRDGWGCQLQPWTGGH